jgi:hypothetical protein
MHQLETPLKLIPDTKIEAEAKQEYKFIGSMNLKRGMRLFSFNVKTLEIKEVILERKAVIDTKMQVHKSSRANYDHQCRYIQASNFDNAAWKAIKFIYGVINRTPVKPPVKLRNNAEFVEYIKSASL